MQIPWMMTPLCRFEVLTMYASSIDGVCVVSILENFQEAPKEISEASAIVVFPGNKVVTVVFDVSSIAMYHRSSASISSELYAVRPKKYRHYDKSNIISVAYPISLLMIEMNCILE
ncbi:hypothetical protein Droror1_Dr00004813 [Drosera rotundifolia]